MTMTPSTAGRVDTRGMIVVHTALRRDFRLAPGLVRGVTPGARRRARVVADHVELISGLLHHHHENEDRLLWPKLKQRVPDELAPTVELMESQHHGLDQELTAARQLTTRWKGTAAAHDRDELANCLDRVCALLVEHLTAEEERILPLAATNLTPAEWGQLGKQGMASMGKKQLPLLFGMYMYEGDPGVIQTMLARAPWLPRMLMPRIAPRVFARYSRRVYGTATP